MVPRSNKNNQTARYGQLYISASLPSIPRGTGPRWTWKLAALSGSSNDSEVTYGVRNFAYVRTIKHARVQRWPEWFTAFDYTLEYRKGSANENADVLSRLPEPATEHERSGSSSLTHVEEMLLSSSEPPCLAFARHRLWCRLEWAGVLPRKWRLGWAAFHLFGISLVSHSLVTYED